MDFKKITNTLPFKIIKLIITIMLCCLLMVIVFGLFVPNDPETGTLPQNYDKWVFISAVVLAIIVDLILDYNSTTRLKYSVSKVEADVNAAAERNNALLEKATRVTEKYANDELGLYSEFADARKTKITARIRTSGEFRGVVENYPELKANEHVLKLLSQIENSENILFNAKSAYALKAAEFNAKIHSFPTALLRKLFKWDDIVIEKTNSVSDDVTDEELGI